MMFMSAMSCSYEFASKDVNAFERSFVKPIKVVLVEPEAIDVEPSVGAKYEDTVPHEAVVPSVVRYLPDCPVWLGNEADVYSLKVIAVVPIVTGFVLVLTNVTPPFCVPAIVNVTSPLVTSPVVS